MTQRLTFNQLTPFVTADLESGLTPALLGPPGIGKSEFLKAIATELGTKVFILAVNQLADASDLTGVRPVKNDDGTFKQVTFPHATLQSAIAYAEANPDENPIIFLDEFNRAPVDVTSACFTFITDRTIGTDKFPSNIRFVVAGNDQGNVTTIDGASITRIIAYRATPDIETFLNVQNGLNPYIKDVLTAYPEYLCEEGLESSEVLESDDDDDDDDSDDDDFEVSFGNEDEEQFKQATVPRTISNLSKWLNVVGLIGTLDDKELNFLKMNINLMQATSDDSPLLSALIAHTGRTRFTNELYIAIEKKYRDSFANVVSVNPNTLPSFTKHRPDQALIDQLNDVHTADEIEDVLKAANVNESVLLWALTSDFKKAINGSGKRNVIATTLFSLNPTMAQTTKQAMLLEIGGSTLDKPMLEHLKTVGTDSSNHIVDVLKLVGTIN